MAGSSTVRSSRPAAADDRGGPRLRRRGGGRPGGGAVPGAVAARRARGVPGRPRAAPPDRRGRRRARRLRAPAPARGRPGGRAPPPRGHRARPRARARDPAPGQGRRLRGARRAPALARRQAVQRPRPGALPERGLRRGGRAARRAARAGRQLRLARRDGAAAAGVGAVSEQPAFYYDLASPDAYLAAERVTAVLGVVPEFVPVRMGGPRRLPLRGGARDLSRGDRAARGGLRRDAAALAARAAGRHGVGDARRHLRQAGRPGRRVLDGRLPPGLRRGPRPRRPRHGADRRRGRGDAPRGGAQGRGAARRPQPGSTRRRPGPAPPGSSPSRPCASATASSTATASWSSRQRRWREGQPRVRADRAPRRPRARPRSRTPSAPTRSRSSRSRRARSSLFWDTGARPDRPAEPCAQGRPRPARGGRVRPPLAPLGRTLTSARAG